MTARAPEPRADPQPPWSRVARSGEIHADRPFAASAGGSDLVLLRTRAGLRAYEARCPHQGALLSEGEVEGDAIVCRNHRWRFDAGTGRRVGGGAECLRACVVREVDGDVLVDPSSLGRRGRASAQASRTLGDLPGPPGLPILGNMLQLDRLKLHAILERWAKEYATFEGPLPADLELANRLPFAAAVANETMRLRPVAPVPPFEPNVDVVLGDLAVPRGTNIVVVSRAATLSSAHFDSPHAFLPERWLEGGAQGKAHDPAVHVPFGSGPRICPGRSLALLEMRVVLAAVYKAFEVERVGSSEDVKEELSFTMTPVGVRARVRRRARP